MRYGIVFPTKEHGSIDEMVARFDEAEKAGLSSAWIPNSSGYDAINLLGLVAREVGRIELGTAVVPTYPRHPLAMAAQALTTAAAAGGQRFALGIGLSHRYAVEQSYGLSYERPARHMREYLSVLLPALRDRKVDFVGETLTGRSMFTMPGSATPSVLLAALQPHMLRLAGALTDGTITWCTGPRAVESQVVPVMNGAAEGAGRPTPRTVVVLPAILTNNEADGRTKAGEQLAGYENIPVYRAVLDLEGVQGPADISIVGDEAGFAAQLKRLEDAGATDFVAILTGTPDERARTMAFLASR